MGEGLGSGGTVAPAALERTIEVIGGMADEAKREGAVAIAAVGTAWLRAVRDRDDVLTAIRERTGVNVEEVSGEDEARLAYAAVSIGLPTDAGHVVVFDTGGGSTQFTFGQDGRVDERFSLPLGAVAYTERFGLDRAVTAEALGEVLSTMAADFASLDGRPTPDALVAMGGAVTNLAAVKHEMAVYDPAIIRGTVLDREEHRPRDRALPDARRRRTPDDRRPAAGAGRGDPGRRLHRPDGDGQARPDVTDRQRLRAPPRGARRAIRRLGCRRARRIDAAVHGRST